MTTKTPDFLKAEQSKLESANKSILNTNLGAKEKVNWNPKSQRYHNVYAEAAGSLGHTSTHNLAHHAAHKKIEASAVSMGVLCGSILTLVGASYYSMWGQYHEDIEDEHEARRHYEIQHEAAAGLGAGAQGLLADIEALRAKYAEDLESFYSYEPPMEKAPPPPPTVTWKSLCAAQAATSK
eukprot:PhM_4_TR4712/c0_g1_i1/m.65081